MLNPKLSIFSPNITATSKCSSLLIDRVHKPYLLLVSETDALCTFQFFQVRLVQGTKQKRKKEQMY